MAPLVITSKLKALSVVFTFNLGRSNIEEWKDCLGELRSLIGWLPEQAKMQQFGDIVWERIKHANLLSMQKLAGYWLLFSCYYPFFIFLTVKLVTIVVTLVIAIASISIQLFGLIVCGLLFKNYCPVFSFIVVKLVKLVVTLVLSIVSITSQLVGFVVFDLIGFTREDIRLFSPAASFQSCHHGDMIPAGSFFPNMQSMGARGSISFMAANTSSIECIFTVVVRSIAGAAGVYLVIDDFLHPAA